MRLNNSTKENPTIDILVAVAAIGGAENCINMLSKYLCEKGCRVRIVQMIYEKVEWAADCAEFTYFFTTRAGHELSDFISSYGEYLKKNGTPDLTIATAWPMMAYVAKRAFSMLGKNITVASWLHAPLCMYKESGYGGGDFIKYADVHFAISDEIAGEIRQFDKDGTIYRVNNPVDLSKIHEIDELTKGTLLFIGRLSKEKNIGIILCAIAIAKTNWKLRIIGDGDEKEELKKLSRELKIEKKVEFVGWSDDPWKYAEGAYALAMSSMYEGSPLVAIEALGCGLPVIANVSSRVGEIIKPGITGFIYEDNNVQDFAKILDMIADDKFPSISPEKCREAIVDFKDERALFDFWAKIYGIINGRRLTSYIWGIGQETIVRDRISVVVPCYNVEKYLKRCLDSILRQTIGRENITIIAVNDASTDSTADILMDYEREYPDTICVVNCEKNGGLSFARNVGLSYVADPYVTFVDSDDMLSDDMLEKLYLLEKCYPSDVVSCEFEVFEGDIPSLEKNETIDIRYTVLQNNVELRQLFIDNSMLHPAWGKLFRTDFIKNNNLSFPEGYRMEDIYFIYLSVAYANAWLWVNMKGYYYYKNNAGIMLSDGRKKYYMDVFNCFALAMEEYRKIGLFDSMKQELALVYYKKVFSNIYKFMLGSFSELPHENANLLVAYMEENFPDIMDNVYLTDDEKRELKGAVDAIRTGSGTY